MPDEPERQHPIEAVYAARDALEHAAAMQAEMSEPTLRTDFRAYGSALTSALNAMGDVVTVLSEQLAGYDFEQLAREAVRDQPVAAAWAALDYLDKLRGVLATAVADANRYWTLVDRADAHTRPPDDTA